MTETGRKAAKSRKTHFKEYFQFLYFKAALVMFGFLLVTTILMFVIKGEPWSSFVCSISAGIISGLTLFIISGLKNYEKENCLFTIELCKNGYKKTNSVCERVAKIFLEQNTISYGKLQDLNMDIMICCGYYRAIIVNQKQKATRCHELERIVKLEKLQSRLKEIIESKNSLEESEELHKDTKPILQGIYLVFYEMKGDFVSAEYEATLKAERMKFSKINWGGTSMDNHNLSELLALLAKMKIHSDLYLSDAERELYKFIVDEAKKQIQEQR